MKRLFAALLGVTFLTLGFAALADQYETGTAAKAEKAATKTTEAKVPATTTTAKSMKLSEHTWADVPYYPAGCKVAEVSTSPGGVGIVYLKIPAGTKIAAHTHPAVHWGSIVSGTGTFGIGTDPAKGVETGPGHYIYLPAKTEHWFTAKTDVVFFGCATGPGIDYVNPADDPRKGQASEGD